MPVDEPTQDDPDGKGLVATIYDQLTRDIVGGQLAPGEKLSEPAIARRFDASRAPVREAIRRLQELGLVTYIVNQGVRVAEPTADEFLSLLAVREALEGMAARLAATGMNDDERRALQTLVEAHSEEIARDHHGAYLQSDPDGDFHRRIAIGSRNPLLSELLCDQLYPRLKLCRRLHATVPGRGREAWREHIRIVDAIVHRDGEMAEILMRRHVQSAKTALLEAMASASRAKG